MKNFKLQKSSFNSFPDGYKTNERFSWKKHCRIANRLLYFCLTDDKIITLSSVIEKIGVDYKTFALPLSHSTCFVDFYFQPFYDQEYLKPIGDVKEIIIQSDYLRKFLISNGMSPSKAEEIVATGKLFNISDYKQFVVDRQEKNNNYGTTADAYLKAIDIYPKNCSSFESAFDEVNVADSIYEHVEDNRRKATEAEMNVMEILDEYKIEYEFQKPVRVFNTAYIMDFFLPSKNICIEIDGSYHNNYHQLFSDKIRDAKMARCGIYVVRFHNSETSSLAAPIQAFLKEIAGFENVPSYGLSFGFPKEDFIRKD